MTKYFKILLPILILITGCSKKYLDINNDPNYPTTAPLSQLLTHVESDLAGNLNIRYGLSNFAAVYMHQITMRENPDQYGVTGSSFYTEGPWDGLYSGPLQDIELMIKTGDDGGNLIYSGIARILKAYTFSLLVDVYADVPYTEANKQTEGNAYPHYDKGENIYPALFTMLNDAITDLTSATATNLFKPGNDDVIYGGSVSKWIHLANSLKLKLYNQIRLTTDVSSSISALITAGNLIGSASESFILPYGTSKSPDNRNPGVLEYEAGQKGFYISPWFYQILKGYNPNILSGVVDPRIPYYWYNQMKDATTATREGNPTEYRDGGFVSIFFGSIGPNRDHAEDGTMTVMGLYPVGGRYDQGDHLKVTGTSCTGAAPYRFFTYADLLYTEAELANTGVYAAGDARALLLSALNASIAQVDQVVTLDQSTQTIPVLAGSAAATTYINSVMSAYDAGTTAKKLEIIMTEKWIQSFGNHVDQWTDYRRTGYPIVFNPLDPTMAPGGFVTSPNGPNPGDPPNVQIPVTLTNAIPYSLPWSQAELSIDPNAPAQKDPATMKVFWDK